MQTKKLTTIVFLSIVLTFALLRCLFVYQVVLARSIHVSKTGNDENSGIQASPYLTINHAAQEAQPGDTVIVHAGVYREHVNLARGGTSETVRIVYKAADGESVVIKGSDVVTNFEPIGNGVYKHAVDNAGSSNYNPFFIKMVKGKIGNGPVHRTLGEVYLDGRPLSEVVPKENCVNNRMTWWYSIKEHTLYANFGMSDLNKRLIEVHKRRQVFAPAKWNLGYITVRGFQIEHSANNYDDHFWNHENVPQHGAISTGGGHHWIIEHNTIRMVKSIGIDFGMQGGKAVQANNFPPYNQRGHHIIRYNKLIDCGTTGMIAYQSPGYLIKGNWIERSNRLRAKGMGKAGIKIISSCIDNVIEENVFLNNQDTHALWVDAFNQGTIVRRNVFLENRSICFELQLGPTSFENNIVLGSHILIGSAGGVLLAHNLLLDTRMTLKEIGRKKGRMAISYKPHTDKKAGRSKAAVPANNFIANNLSSLPLIINNEKEFENRIEGNISLPSIRDANIRVDNKAFTVHIELKRIKDLDTVDLLTEEQIGNLNPFVKQSLPAINQDFMKLAFSDQAFPGPFAELNTRNINFVFSPFGE